ncbi:amidase signature enzyme [Colletotrichum sublineola]|nr:amidase signature enzyme [Colletotrichum sublineola]
MASFWYAKAVSRLLCSVYAASFCRRPSTASFPPLLDATLDDLRQGLDSSLFTSVDLVNAYVARINKVNNDLRAIAKINPDAVSIAASLDQARTQGEPHLGHLHGIPVLLKDNIATNDKMNNTAGSFALLGAKVGEDSTVADKLRRAGAASLGTETLGLITMPCNVSNLMGIKPTLSLISRHLIIPITKHQDVVSPMARTVKDATHLLAAITRPDPQDNYTSAIPFTETPNYATAYVDSGLQGKQIGDHITHLLSLSGQVMGADFLVNLEEYFAKLTYNPYNITTELYTKRQYLTGPLGYKGALKNHSLNALVLPTKYILGPTALLGTPVITVPFRRHPDDTQIVKDNLSNLDVLAPNLPFGIGFAGTAFSKENLISMAYAFEQRTKAQNAIKPYIQPKTKLGDIIQSKEWRTNRLDLL